MKKLIGYKDHIVVPIFPIVVFCIFWTFGVNFGLKNEFFYIFLSILGISAFLIFSYKHIGDLSLTIKRLHIMFAIGFCILLWILIPSFKESASGDQLFHLLGAYQIPIGIIDRTNLFSNWNISNFFWIYSIFITSIFFLTIYIYKLNRNFFIISSIVIGLIIFLTKAIINPDISHPELRTLPIVIFGSLDINNLSFKIQGLIPILFLVIFILRFKEDIGINVVTAFLAIISALSLPLFFYNIGNVDFSIWSFSAISIFLIYITSLENYHTQKGLSLMLTMVAIASLIRQNIAFIFIPLFIYILLNKRFDLIRVTLIFAMIPIIQILNSLNSGYPALSGSEQSIISKLYFSIDPLYMFHKLNNLTILSVFMYLYALIGANRKQLLFLIPFLLVYWVVFHSIDVVLWSIPRYLMEYILPISMLGFLQFYKSIKEKKISSYLIFTFILSMNCFFIISNYKNLSVSYPFEYNSITINQKFDDMLRLKNKYISDEVYDWSIAVNKLPPYCYDKLKANINFGVFPLAFNKKIKVEEFIKSHRLTGNKLESLQNCQLVWSLADQGLAKNIRWNTNLRLIKN